jgi:hypothetical protein
MKKLLIAVASILFTAGVSVAPALADDVFGVRINPCGDPGTPAGCGSNPAATDPLRFGEVTVTRGGRVWVVLQGAVPNTLYRVFVGNWVTRDGFQFQFIGSSESGSIGTVRTDSRGDYTGRVITDAGRNFSFPEIRIGQPNLAFNNGGQTQFTTGYRATLFD